MNNSPPPEVYRPRKLIYFWFLLMCIVFTAAGVWIVKSPGYKHPDKDRVMGVFCTLLFGALGIMSGLQLLPNSLRLTSGPDGFSVRTLWWTTNFYRWADVEKFGVTEFTVVSNYPVGPPSIIKGHVSGGMHCRLVGFNFSSAYPGGGPAWRFKDFNRKTYGFDGLLPDCTEDCDQLAAHLNQLREQSVASARTA